MAMAIIRPFPLFYKGKKVAEVTQGTYDVASGDEAQIGAEGIIGFSDGTTMTKIDATLIVPVRGVQVTILADMLAKKYVTVGVLADAKMQQMDMRITNATYDWDMKSGSAKGKFTFQGGQPDLAG